MTLSPCKKCEVCAHKKHCPVDNQDMFSEMGNVGIENTCTAFTMAEPLELNNVAMLKSVNLKSYMNPRK